jgi:hypothetical protein
LALDGIKPPLGMAVEYQANERLQTLKSGDVRKKKTGRQKKSVSIICFQVETPVG